MTKPLLKVRASVSAKLGKQRARNRAYAKTDLARDVLLPELLAAGIERPEVNYRFHESRRWPFDLAWPEKMLAIEVHGGDKRSRALSRAHAGGRLTADCEKIREAQLLGWTVLPFTGSEVKERIGDVIACVKRAISALEEVAP